MDKLELGAQKLREALNLVEEAIRELKEAAPVVVDAAPSLREVAQWISTAPSGPPQDWDGETVSLLGSDIELIDDDRSTVVLDEEDETPTEKEPVEPPADETKETPKETTEDGTTEPTEPPPKKLNLHLQVTRTFDQVEPQGQPMGTEPNNTTQRRSRSPVRPQRDYVYHRRFASPRSPRQGPPTGRFDPNSKARGIIWSKVVDLRSRPHETTPHHRRCIFCSERHFSDSCQEYRRTRTRRYLRRDKCMRCTKPLCKGCEEEPNCLYCYVAVGHGFDLFGQRSHHSAFCNMADYIEDWLHDLAEANPGRNIRVPPPLSQHERTVLGRIAILDDIKEQERKEQQERYHRHAWGRASSRDFAV